MAQGDGNGRDACAPLLSLAVHELRTPAGVVQGYLHMLQQIAAGTLDDRQRRMVDEAERSCARLIRIVAEIGEFARLATGTAFASEPIDLFALVDFAAANLQEGADRGIRFAAAGSGAGARIIGDPARLREALSTVFYALLRERAHPCAIVADRRIVVDRGERVARVAVAPADDLQAVVGAAREPFDDRRSGLGFALVIAARVVAAHGGTLWSPTDRTRGAVIIEFPLPD